MFKLLLRPMCLWSLLALSACGSITPALQVAPSASTPASAPTPTPIVTLVPVPAPPSPSEEAGHLLLRWQDALRQAAPETLPPLAARLASEPATPSGMVHLALVWLHTHTPGDAARALTQLEGLANSANTATDPAAAAWADWLPLLSARAAEQKRLEEQITRQTQQLRDNQRRIDQLTEQLEALKAIERSLAPRSMGKP